ncbi:MAG: DUF4258 domain-containing protein [Mesoflavibacter sp.]|nr:DUF4258 domain-containing protein [Mesoflavibacter sp.]
MKFIHRLGYYLGGFAIGLVLLAFFLNGSKTSCQYDYGPESRVLKDINNKVLKYSEDSQVLLQNKAIDTTTIKNILKEGDVVFSKSEPRKEPCGIYHIEKEKDNKTIILTVKKCKKTVTLQSIKIKD